LILSQVAGVLFFLRIAAFGLFPSVKTRNGVFQILIRNTPILSIFAYMAVIEQVNLFATPAGHVRQEGVETANSALFFEFFCILKCS
jgi:hypothetical protein